MPDGNNPSIPLRPAGLVTILQLADGQIEAVKAVIAGGCLEFFGRAPAGFQDTTLVVIKTGRAHYMEKFL